MATKTCPCSEIKRIERCMNCRHTRILYESGSIDDWFEDLARRDMPGTVATFCSCECQCESLVSAYQRRKAFRRKLELRPSYAPPLN